MGTAQLIKTRRQTLGLDPKALAVALKLNEPSYWDLESYDDEIVEVVDIRQALALAKLLDIRLLNLLGEEIDCRRIVPMSFEGLRDFIIQKIASCEIDGFGLSWDISDFIANPELGFENPIAFLKILAPEVGFDWRVVIAHYDKHI